MRQIEGVPDGWEAVRFGLPRVGEWLVGSGGKPLQAIEPEPRAMWLIIRRIAPVCTWQHGVFADGWIAEDASGAIWIYSDKPQAESSGWILQHNSGWAMKLNSKAFVSPICFRDDLQWTNRIQQVGPTIEAQLRGEQ